MNRHAASLPLAVCIALVTAQASASVPAATSSGAKTPGPAPQTLSPKPAPAVPANPSHFYTVNDEKGLVLTCVAPELDANPDTVLFKNCTLAPGRTLDDVMHTFIQGIHYEQSQHEKEREEWLRDLDEKAAQKPPQK